jgi:arsenate reductase
MLFLEYPPCSTCKKAKKWLQDNGLEFSARHIKEQNPTAEEISLWQEKSGLELKKFFNTSGMIYRDLGLKDKLPGMSREEQLALLASDGMLVKRPILVTGDTVLVGFKEKDWEKLLQK